MVCCVQWLKWRGHDDSYDEWSLPPVVSVLNAIMIVFVVYAFKDSSVNSSGQMFVKGTSNAISTGTMEEVLVARANNDTFDAIVINSDVLRSRPNAISVDFTDGSFVEFEPTSITLGGDECNSWKSSAGL